MQTREQFYKSKEWEAFRRVIIAERTDADGFVHCAMCGKPILHKYDLIVHHKHELDDSNYKDAMIALNPDNVECVCFRCHNRIHDRWQGGNNSGYKPPQKHVYIVYGSPCAGKSTWVHDNATEDDLVVDMDRIWQMISINDSYVKPAALKMVAFQIRDELYDVIKYRIGKWHNAFVITGGAFKGDRDRLKQRVGADELIFIDESYDTCVQRVEQKGLPDDQKDNWIHYIQDWFEKFQPDD